MGRTTYRNIRRRGCVGSQSQDGQNVGGQPHFVLMISGYRVLEVSF